MNTKAGFVAIIGRPNSGKSTLMNSILGTKLSIVTRKAQTTRKRVIGIYSDDNLQLVFIDTPGIINPKYQLQKTMMEYVEETLKDADIILLVIDSLKFHTTEEFFSEETLEAIKTAKQPKIAVFNKIDLLDDIKLLLPKIDELSKLEIFDEIVPVSAKKLSGVDTITNVLSRYTPENEFYYDPEHISTQQERFFVAEIIREQIFKFYSEEVPYSTEVQIMEFKEREMGKWYISANIIVEKKSQKIILIGENGQKIKQLGKRARIQIENFLEMPVYLELFVKVREKWRNDKKRLKSFGY